MKSITEIRRVPARFGISVAQSRNAGKAVSIEFRTKDKFRIEVSTIDSVFSRRANRIYVVSGLTEIVRRLASSSVRRRTDRLQPCFRERTHNREKE